MNFRSLKNVLQSDRASTQVVAYEDGQTVCWAQFLSDVSLLRSALVDANKSNCAICCEDSYYFCVAFFAVIYAQKKIVLPGNHQPAMLEALSDHFDVIIHDDLVNNLAKTQLQLPLIDGPINTNFSFYELDLDQIQLTLFTSGSSGLPKAIHKSLLMLDREIIQLEALWGELLAGSYIVSSVSHQHIYGLLFRILWPLCAGRAFHRIDLVYPEQIFACATEDCTLISSPALLKRLDKVSRNTSYRAIFSSGGPLNVDSARQSKILFDKYPWEVFGSTETGGIGYRQQLMSSQPWALFSGIEAQLGENSCLELCSPWVDEKAWYQTSDQCELLENKQFILKGRIDRIVKVEEKRISLIEVEQRMNQLQWIDDSAVLLLYEPQRLSLGAVIKLSAEGESILRELGKGQFWIKLRQALRMRLDPVGIPRHYRVVSDIPVNKQGKRLHSEISRLFG